MDQENEIFGFKLILILFFLFCFSGFKSCQELDYRTSGKVAITKIDKIMELREERKGSYDYKVLDYKALYSFQNENSNKRVNGSSSIGLDGLKHYDIGQEIEVEYIGTERYDSRIKGTGSLFWVILFVIMCLAFGGSLVLFIMHANEKVKKLGRKRR